MIETSSFFIKNRIFTAPLVEDPFPNFYAEDVFPEGLYRQMLENLPPTDRYTLPPRVTNATAERLICDADKLDIPFWDDLTKWMLGTDFAEMLIEKFKSSFVKRFKGQELKFGNDTRLVRDFENYQIKPHTDTPVKAISLLFYLPKDESDIGLGTSLYVPKDPNMRCDGQRRHLFDLFNKVYTAPFKPNSVFGFFKTDKSFHGVEPIHLKSQRDVFLYNLYAAPK